MTKAKLIEAMQTARAEWEDAVDRVGQERMSLAVLHGNWTVKDTIGHVAYYERWLLRWLEDSARGQLTVASHRDLLAVDQRNALIWAENKDRMLKDILDESRIVFDRLLQLVKILPESDLVDPYVYARYVIPFWGKAQPLWECIAGDSYDHYREHTENINRWLEQTTPSVESQFVPLTTG